MEELDQLEHLNLVSRVVTELENHFGLADKDVAEFIISLAKTSRIFNIFKKSLLEQGLGDSVRYFLFFKFKKYYLKYFFSLMMRLLNIFFVLLILLNGIRLAQ